MSDQTNIVLNDGQTTPVAKTFSARGADMALAKWKDVSSGIPIGFPQITASFLERAGVDSTSKVEYRITLPVLETISGSDGGYTPAPRVAYTCLAKVEFVLPNRATAQNRKDILAYAKNLLAHSLASEYVVDFNPAN